MHKKWVHKKWAESQILMKIYEFPTMHEYHETKLVLLKKPLFYFTYVKTVVFWLLKKSNDAIF